MTFDVFGPKALACINGLPPALASRCITLMMFRAPKESNKPRRRIDAEPATWAGLRDDLHALALEHGPTLMGLANRADVCLAMRGRDYELWQPILALAARIESAGAVGLLRLMQDYAVAMIDSGTDDATSDADETLLRTLADLLRIGERPQPKEILEKALQADSETFKRWTPKGVSNVLKRYGCETRKSHGTKVYGDWAPAALRRVQESYGIDLGYTDDEPAT